MIGSSRYSLNTIKHSQSITMVHFNTEARTGHPLVKEVIKLLKAGNHVPDIVFNPFSLKLCLSMTSLKQYRQVLVDGLKSVIGKVSHLEVGTNGILYDTEVQVLISNFGISGQEDDISFVQWSTVMHTFVFSLSPFWGLCHQEIQSGSLKNI